MMAARQPKTRWLRFHWYLVEDDCIVDKYGVAIYTGLESDLQLLPSEQEALLNLLNNGYDEWDWNQLSDYVQPANALRAMLMDTTDDFKRMTIQVALGDANASHEARKHWRNQPYSR